MSVSAFHTLFKPYASGSWTFSSLFLRLLSAKAWISFSPDRRKSKNSTSLYLHVSDILNITRYSRIPFSEVIPLITRRRVANALIACSALLLFQGTPSCTRKVNNFSLFFSKRLLNAPACSLRRSVFERLL